MVGKVIEINGSEYLFGTVRCASHREHTELIAKNNQLCRTNAVRDRFLPIIAHEFLNSLAVLL